MRSMTCSGSGSSSGSGQEAPVPPVPPVPDGAAQAADTAAEDAAGSVARMRRTRLDAPRAADHSHNHAPRWHMPSPHVGQAWLVLSRDGSRAPPSDTGYIIYTGYREKRDKHS